MAITTGFNHVATLTADLDRLKAWYFDVFEAETVFEMQREGDHPRMAILDLGGGSALNVQIKSGTNEIHGKVEAWDVPILVTGGVMYDIALEQSAGLTRIRIRR